MIRPRRMASWWAYFLGQPSPDSPFWRRWHAALLSVIGFVGAAIFWHFAMHTATAINVDLTDPRKIHDQTIYLDQAYFMRQLGAAYVAPRQHMPGYGALLAPFLRRGEGTYQFFERAKGLAVLLSLAAAAGLVGVLRLILPWTESVLLALAGALLVYVFRGGYFQPELLFNTLFLLSLILLLKMLVRPGWGLAVSAGAALAAAQALKASMLPALGLFSFAFVVRLLIRVRGRPPRASLREAAMGVLVPALFWVLLSPYLVTSKRLFGSYFYSSYTRYHMWVDTNAESRALSKLRLGERSVRFDEPWLRRNVHEYESHRGLIARWRDRGLPGPARYLKERTPPEIARITAASADRLVDRIKRDYPGLIRFCHGLIAIVAVVLVINWSEAIRLLRRHWLVVMTALLWIVGYFAAYAFYGKVGMGPRLLLTLVMPVLTVLCYATWIGSRDVVIPSPFGGLSLRKLANLAIALALVDSARRVLSDEIYRVVGGQ